MSEDVRELLDREPFEPFYIVTSSGDRYLVEDPHSVALMTGRLFVAPKNEKWVFIQLSQVAALEPVSRAA